MIVFDANNLLMWLIYEGFTNTIGMAISYCCYIPIVSVITICLFFVCYNIKEKKYSDTHNVSITRVYNSVTTATSNIDTKAFSDILKTPRRLGVCA